MKLRQGNHVSDSGVFRPGVVRNAELHVVVGLNFVQQGPCPSIMTVQGRITCAVVQPRACAYHRHATGRCFQGR